MQSPGPLYNLRCYLCEVLTGWALKISPEGNVPGMARAAVELAKKERMHSYQNLQAFQRAITRGAGDK